MSNEPEEERGIISYTPIGEKDPIKLSLAIAKKHIINPTKSGAWPTDKEIFTFLMLCRARGLNPFLGDCVITGYDTRDQGPQFSIITSKSALDKRADLHDQYSGIESGVVVLKKGDVIEKREGAIVLPSEELLGGWAIVYRKDRTDHPIKHDVNLEAYDKKRALWNTDKPGMIVKCAEAGALRKAFPNSFADLYLAEEAKAIEAIREADVTSIETKAAPAGPAVPSGFQRQALPERSSKETVETAASEAREKAPVERRTAPVEERKPVEKSAPAPVSKPEPAGEEPPFTTDPDPAPAPAPAKEKEKPASKAPAPAPAPAQSSDPVREGVHKTLLEEAAKHSVSEADLVRVARAFFGAAYEAYNDVPEARIESMLANIDDVIAEAKS